MSRGQPDSHCTGRVITKHEDFRRLKWLHTSNHHLKSFPSNILATDVMLQMILLVCSA